MVELLLAGGDLGFGARHFDGRQRADLHLLLVVLPKRVAAATASRATRTLSLNATRSQYRLITAATVVSTCSLKVRSETSRLFLAMWICRELTAGPKPCSRCCVMHRPSEELVDGLKSLRGLLLVTELLFSPR